MPGQGIDGEAIGTEVKHHPLVQIENRTEIGGQAAAGFARLHHRQIDVAHVNVVGIFELTHSGDMVAVAMGDKDIHRHITAQGLNDGTQITGAHAGVDEQAPSAAFDEVHVDVVVIANHKKARH